MRVVGRVSERLKLHAQGHYFFFKDMVDILERLKSEGKTVDTESRYGERERERERERE